MACFRSHPLWSHHRDDTINLQVSSNLSNMPLSPWSSPLLALASQASSQEAFSVSFVKSGGSQSPLLVLSSLDMLSLEHLTYASTSLCMASAYNFSLILYPQHQICTVSISTWMLHRHPKITSSSSSWHRYWPRSLTKYLLTICYVLGTFEGISVNEVLTPVKPVFWPETSLTSPSPSMPISLQLCKFLFQKYRLKSMPRLYHYCQAHSLTAFFQ